MVAYRKMKKNNTEHIVYCTICSNPGMNTYELSKKLNMTGGRVRHAISKLKEDGLVKFKIERRTARLKKLVYPIEVWRLLPRKIKYEMKKLLGHRANGS